MRGRNHGGERPSAARFSTPVRRPPEVVLNRNHVFDSNGPGIRVRGTAQQLFERYDRLGKDSQMAGDAVSAQAYFQHAEHYFRIIGAIAQAAQASEAAVQAPPVRHHPPQRPTEELAVAPDRQDAAVPANLPTAVQDDVAPAPGADAGKPGEAAPAARRRGRPRKPSSQPT